MNPYAITFLVACASAFALSLAMGRLGRRWGVVDRPDGFRKVHGREVPLLGGVAVYGAFVASLLVCSAVTGDGAVTGRTEAAASLASSDFLLLIGGATVVLLIGLIDDVWGMRARWKLLLMLLVSIAMYVGGFRIAVISNPFGAPIHFGWLAVPVTVFWFMGCMNAVNLIDGMDGLASGVTLFVAATLFMTATMFGNVPAALLAIALAGSALGFLVLNFHPARIFLGDGGSLLLGFLIAGIGLRGSQKSHTVVALLIPVIALGLPIMDTSLAIVRRWLKAVPFMHSDRQHIHHKLLEMGLTHRVAVVLMYGACLVLCQIALLMTAANNRQAAGLLVILGLVTFLAIRMVGRHEIKLLKVGALGRIRRRNERIKCRAAGYIASASMRHAETIDDLWALFTRAAEKMDLHEAELTACEPVPGADPRMASRRWQSPERAPHPDDALWTVVLPLRANGSSLGSLHVRKLTNGQPLPADIPETLQLLSKALAVNLARVQPGVGSAVESATPSE